MAIGEIVPAFKGIADRFVKGAKPALDAPTVFPFAPNAVIIGFYAALQEASYPFFFYLCLV